VWPVDKDVPDKAPSIPLQFDIDLNRPAKFTIELVANDKVNGKETKITLPLPVMKIK
jgi:hypothetical protein